MRTTPFAWLSCLLLAAGIAVLVQSSPEASASPRPNDDDRLTLLSANILYCDPFRETRDSYHRRRSGLIGVIGRLQPDVIVLQEVSDCLFFGPLERTAATVAEALHRRGMPYRMRFWVSEELGGLWREGLALMWNPHRVAVPTDGIHCRHLARTYPYGMLRITKSLCMLTVHPAGANLGAGRHQPVVVANTHLDARRRAVREAQAREVLQLLADGVAEDTPAILMGDLNSQHMAPLFRHHGWRLVHQKRYDYVLTRNVPEGHILRVAVVPLVKRRISDHDGVVLTISWPRSDPPLSGTRSQKHKVFGPDVVSGVSQTCSALLGVSSRAEGILDTD